MSIIAVLATVLAGEAQSSLVPHSLRIEHNVPVGQDLGFTDALARPRFSWQLSAVVAARGVAQTAYRLRIVRIYDESVVVDTGKIMSQRQTFIAPHDADSRAEALDADTAYKALLEAWSSDGAGKTTAYFHTALRASDPSDWQGEWIGGYTQLRASFEIPSDKQVSSASAYASGIGCFDLSVNGAPAAANVSLEPGFSTVPTVRQLYSAYNVKSLLRPGENAVGFRLGMCKYGYLDTFCEGAQGSSPNCRAAILQLNVKFTDGSGMNVTTRAGGDPTTGWVGTNDANPVRYTHLFHGETFDARLDEPFDEPNFRPANTGAWGPAESYNTSRDGIGSLSLQVMPKISVIERRSPITINETTPSSGGGGGGGSLDRCTSATGYVVAATAAEDAQLTLRCESGSIKEIEFASFGTPGFGRFIKDKEGTDVFWQGNSALDNGTKHHVADCTMCGIEICGEITPVSKAEIDALTAGPDFTCDMLGDCSDFEASSQCAADATEALQSACVGRSACNVTATASALGVSDPCYGVSKRLFVRAAGCPPAVLPKPRSFIFDFGQNFAGVVEFNFSAIPDLPAGTQLTLRHAELLHEDGTLYNSYCKWPCSCSGGNCANQTDVYIASGREKDTRAVWRPKFTYHGFRFMQLDGWPLSGSAPPPLFATGLLTASAVPSTGSVHFANQSLSILNSIQTMILYTQRSNLHSHPTDCPQREKRGWLGDAQWTAGEASMNFDMASLYSNWIRTMGDTQAVECNQVAWAQNNRDDAFAMNDLQRPPTYECCSLKHPTFGCDWTGTNFSEVVGSLPDVVPYSRKTYGGWPGDPTWGVAAVVLPWELYTRTGDVDILAGAYPVAKALVDFLTRHQSARSGLVEFGYYGDWCSLEKTAKPAVTGWSHILGVARLADIASALGKSDDAAEYTTLLGTLKSRYHAAYFDNKTGLYGTSQTANILPLFLNITPPALVPQVADAVAASLKSRNLGLTSGAMGTRYVFQALAQSGYADLALDIATATEQPSFGYMALQGPAGGGLGAGTVWEHWGGNAYDYGGGSKNHPMFAGGVGLWLYQLAGLSVSTVRRTASGHSDVVLEPGAGDVSVAIRLGSATVRHVTPVGSVVFSWRYQLTASSARAFQANVTIPIGLNHPAQLRVRLGSDALCANGGITVEDLDRSARAALSPVALRRGESWTGARSAGIASIAAHPSEPGRVDLHLLSGRFALRVSGGSC